MALPLAIAACCGCPADTSALVHLVLGRGASDSSRITDIVVAQATAPS